VNAGHCREKIVKAVQKQVAELDFAPTFQMGHPLAFEFADKLASIAPGDLKRVFFTNSGSESVDTALKLALAYHRARGEGHRMRLIGRERGYHGVNFGGTAVGGVVGNRKVFGALVAGVDHIRHTHDLAKNAFSRGQPKHGAELADDLERLCALHDPSTIAAVIVEPVACSGGVLVPPVGYLERLRAICDQHGILLIFDEVITAWGRLGKPFGAQHFNVMPDLITTAKGITNGTVPMGAVFMRERIYEAFMTGPEGSIELAHGYTYSSHPLACAAGLATLQTYEEEGLLTRAAELWPYWEEQAHALKGLPNVVDIRNIGLIAAIELAPRPGAPGMRGLDAHVQAFEKGAYIRVAGDIIALAPPLIIRKEDIDRLFEIVRGVLKTTN
jgi:beta-alanine--pyruvate transaminase